ncbi:transglycosylase SLT domain-containing protein [Sulfoacidibacillus ferrooxidans]|uniref:transglycosylase SLT domain-containing protein n=1 Tax=Sulfoacidibacillus ferrooxidans TaxID=2005001 RepID=UPI001F504F6E
MKQLKKWLRLLSPISKIPTNRNELILWLIVKGFMYFVGPGMLLAMFGILVAGSIFAFFIGDFTASGNGTVSANGQVTLSQTQQIQEHVLQKREQIVANQWQTGLDASQIEQVQTQQVNVPSALLMSIGKVVNNLQPLQASLYYGYFMPQYTWIHEVDIKETFHDVTTCTPKGTCKTTCVENQQETPVTFLSYANTWDGTLTDTYVDVTTGHAGCPDGVWTSTWELLSSHRTYSWAKVWNLFAHIKTQQGTFIEDTANRDVLAGMIGAVDPSLGDPYVQHMVSGFNMVFQTGGLPPAGSNEPLPSAKVMSILQQAIGIVMAYNTAHDISGGVNESWLPYLAIIVMHESGGNPDAVDPILVDGEHASGLMQMLPSTFVSDHLGAYTDIWNPLDNAISAIGHIESAWGNPTNIPGVVAGTGVYHGY